MISLLNIINFIIQDDEPITPELIQAFHPYPNQLKDYFDKRYETVQYLKQSNKTLPELIDFIDELYWKSVSNSDLLFSTIYKDILYHLKRKSMKQSIAD